MEIIPVIHVLNETQTLKSVEHCQENGIKKIFLIHHSGRPDAVSYLCGVYQAVRKSTDLWVGLNFLQMDTLDSITYCNGLDPVPDGIWCDNAHIVSPDDGETAPYIKKSKDYLFGLSYTCYFGGVEFKYQKQPHESDLKWVYEQATKYIDVITTSGQGTGKKASIEKLKRIREMIGNHKLAVASGVDETNIQETSKYVNYALVASSITDPSSEIIIPERLKGLIEASTHTLTS